MNAAENGAQWNETQYRGGDLNNPKLRGVFSVTQTLAHAATGRIVHVRSVSFDPEKFKLAVIDNSRGDETLAAAMQRCGAVAGVNGSYFHADRTPVGLEISAGKMVHSFERAKLLTGVLAIKSGRASLLRSTEFSPREKLDDALQCGPFLLDAQGNPITGLENTRRAWRTAVMDSQLGDEGQHQHFYRLIVCEPVTLAEFAEILATRLKTGTTNKLRALNLDGGSSTGMWISETETSDIGNPNVNVPNYLAVVPR